MTPSIQFSKPWALRSAGGRYEETEFTFEYLDDEAGIQVLLRGSGSSGEDVRYELSLRRIDEDTSGVQQEYTVGTYGEEKAAFEATERFLRTTENAIQNEVLPTGSSDEAAFERFVATFGDDTLTSMLAKILENLSPR
jgi:hypothetical protein